MAIALPMATRPKTASILLAAALMLAGCSRDDDSPIAVSAVGGPPRPVNPNLQPIDPPAAFLMEATAQGLVRFNAEGEIEPALAQSWIVSDDGLRYTFRIRRMQWTAAARSPPRRSPPAPRRPEPGQPKPVKPVLGPSPRSSR